jgi:hypothetical protein
LIKEKKDKYNMEFDDMRTYQELLNDNGILRHSFSDDRGLRHGFSDNGGLWCGLTDNGTREEASHHEIRWDL